MRKPSYMNDLARGANASNGIGARRVVTLLARTATVLAVLGAGVSHAQHFEQGMGDPRVASPVGTGPTYTGLTGAAVGLTSKKPLYGVEAGEFIVQPRFFTEARFDSNFFKVDERTSGQETEGIIQFRFKPGMALFNPKFDKIAFSLAVDLDIMVPVTGSEVVKSQTNIAGSAKVAAALWPKRPVTLTLYNDFKRTLYMRPTITTTANQNRNKVGADLSLHPGGRALDFTVGYGYRLTRYDDIDQLNSDEHILRFMASWRFYPMTYLFIESSYTIYDFVEPRPSGTTDFAGNYVSGSPVKAYLGLSGAFTERIAGIVRLGYGDSLLDSETAGFDGFIGQLQLAYRFSAEASVNLGAARDFELTPLGGSVSYNRLYTGFTVRFGKLVELNADFSYDWRFYGEWEPAPGTSGNSPLASEKEREEQAVKAGVTLDFDISRLIGVTVGYRYEASLTDYALLYGSQVVYSGYNNHRAFASFNLRY